MSSHSNLLFCPFVYDSSDDASIAKPSRSIPLSLTDWQTNDPESTWLEQTFSSLSQQEQQQRWIPCGTELWKRLGLDHAESHYQHVHDNHAYALAAPLVWHVEGAHPALALPHWLSTWPRPLLPLVIRYDPTALREHHAAAVLLASTTTSSSSSSDKTAATFTITTTPQVRLTKLWKKLGYWVVEGETQTIAMRIAVDADY